MGIDVFISYEHESKSIADNICSVLESKSIRCWYAPRDVYGDYATSIVNAIEGCRVFVLILNDKASCSPHVLNEVEMAYQRILNGEITIVPFKVDAGTLSKAMEYYVKRLHWIDAVSDSLENAIHHLYTQLVPILGIKEETTDSLKDKDSNAETNLDRKYVQYYSNDDPIEGKRLMYEDELLYDYEKIYYDKLLFGQQNICVLDLQTLTPTATIKRLQRDEISKVVSFSYNEDLVNFGNSLVKNKSSFRFYKLNYEKDDIDSVIQHTMLEMNIEKFDLINLSMAVMDMKNPFKILKKLKKYVRPNGLTFIRDIDDGVVFAYPDEHNYFEQFKEFYKYDTLSGSRKSGRQIYNVMRKLGAKEIKLERVGINSSNMDYFHKRLMFESWFSFIPNDFRLMLKKDPNNAKAKEVLAWVDEYYDDLEEEFFADEFLFNAGYLIYTVRF
jgi:SAM-dependent methyltransferase